MRITYFQGDGSFEIVLKKKEILPREWNIENSVVLVEQEDGSFNVIKNLGGKLSPDMELSQFIISIV